MDHEELYDLIPEDDESSSEALKNHVESLLPTIESIITISILTLKLLRL